MRIGAERLSPRDKRTDVSRSDWEEFAERALLGCYRLDAAGRLSHANLALAKLLGYGSVPELMAARGDFRAGLYADPEQPERVSGQLRQGGDTAQHDAELIRADNSRLWATESITVLLDSKGTRLGEVGTLMDISDRHRDEEALAESEERYRVLVEHSQDGVFLFKDGKYLYVNHAYAQMLGYEPSEMIGVDTSCFFAPGEHERIEALWDERRAGNWERMNYATRLLMKDGQTEIPVSVNAGPIRYLGGDASQGTVRNLASQQQAKVRIAAAERRYRDVVEHAAVGIYRSTREGRLLHANAALAKLLGYASPENLMSKIGNVAELYVHDSQRRALVDKLDAESSLRNEELRMRRRDGGEIWLQETSWVVSDEPGCPVCYEGMLIDVTARKEAEAALRHQAHHDALTGLPNRQQLHEHLGLALAEISRDQRRHAVFFIDMNVLKRVNDSLGHGYGDQLLQEAADRLQSIAGPDDVIGRHEGDQFVLLARDIAEQGEADAVAARIRRVLDPPFLLRGFPIHARPSIGTVLCHADYKSPADVLRDADAAMLRNKQGADDDDHVIFDNSMHSAAMERLKIESAIRAGLIQDQFEMYYQPVCELESGRIVAFEALMRWNHPERGLLMPADFMAVAEETGLMSSLTQHGLREALAACASWQQPAPGTALAFNLSSQGFASDRLPEFIASEITHSRLPAGLLHLELTEAVLVDDFARARRLLQALHALGVKVHIDDFGAGYSRLSYLNELSFDALKLDKLFVSRLVSNPRTRAIVESIIELGRGLGLEVIAEGVESEAQASALAALHCRLVQGHLYGIPMNAQAALERLQNAH